MNSKLKLALIILIVIVALGLVTLAVIYLPELFPAEATPSPTPVPTVEPTPEPTPEPAPQHVNTTSAVIAAGGDIVMHTGLNSEALMPDGTYYYTPIFGILRDYISAADYGVCSLVTSLSAAPPYSAYPMFKTPYSLAYSLKESGFDLINTGTSHCMDGFKGGLDTTLNSLDYDGLAHVGTYRTQEEKDLNGGVTLADIKGIKVAFVSFTCETNRIPVAGFEYAVNVCTKDYLSQAEDIDYDAIDDSMKAAEAAGADAVFVFVSWGTEFSTEPSEVQKVLADYIFSKGADVIIGGHCRVPQPMELREITEADGSVRTGYICYSLGNMLSCQNDEFTNISAIVNITFTKDTDTGETWISDVVYKPIYMADLNDFDIEGMDWHYRMIDLHAAIDSDANGARWGFITDDLLADMKASLDYLLEFFGPELDVKVKAEAAGA